MWLPMKPAAPETTASLLVMSRRPLQGLHVDVLLVRHAVGQLAGLERIAQVLYRILNGAFRLPAEPLGDLARRDVIAARIVRRRGANLDGRFLRHFALADGIGDFGQFHDGLV